MEYIKQFINYVYNNNNDSHFKKPAGYKNVNTTSYKK